MLHVHTVKSDGDVKSNHRRSLLTRRCLMNDFMDDTASTTSSSTAGLMERGGTIHCRGLRLTSPTRERAISIEESSFLVRLQDATTIRRVKSASKPSCAHDLAGDGHRRHQHHKELSTLHRRCRGRGWSLNVAARDSVKSARQQISFKR